MMRRWRQVSIPILALAALLGGASARGSSSSTSSSPRATIESFLDAAAAGDGAAACAQLSPAARRQVVQGAACERGIELGAGLYRSIITQVTIAGLTVHGDTARGTSMLNGQPIARFQLSKSGGRWLITGVDWRARPEHTGYRVSTIAGACLGGLTMPGEDVRGRERRI